MQRWVSLGLVLAVGAVLVFVVSTALPPFGTFPQRKFGGLENQSVGQQILEDAPAETGGANIITTVVWDYRAYDTLGEATVLFTAVCGCLMLFLATRRRK